MHLWMSKTTTVWFVYKNTVIYQLPFWKLSDRQHKFIQSGTNQHKEVMVLTYIWSAMYKAWVWYIHELKIYFNLSRMKHK
jgi:hypothetical protein